MRLFLRLFANCESTEVAANIAERLALALSWLGPGQASPPKPYWKLPHLYEFTYVLSAATRELFQEVVSRSPAGWEHSASGEERSSVWNRSADCALLIPEVSWAEVQLHECVA